MMLSKFIAELQRLKARYGDVPCVDSEDHPIIMPEYVDVGDAENPDPAIVICEKA